jgi:hypothetical protein
MIHSSTSALKYLKIECDFYNFKPEKKSITFCCFGGGGAGSRGVTNRFLKEGLRYSSLKEIVLIGRSFEVSKEHKCSGCNLRTEWQGLTVCLTMYLIVFTEGDY